MKISSSTRAAYDDSEKAGPKPINEAAVMEMYEEMQMYIAALCKNPNAVNIRDGYVCPNCEYDLADEIVALAHSLMKSSKTMQLAMFEEMQKNRSELEMTVDDYFINDAADKVAGI